jgi:very-short-patch-repair endonuclease
MPRDPAPVVAAQARISLGLMTIAQLDRCQVGLRPAGGRVARVDLLWDDARLVVELDGHADHATRRRRQADAERSARLGLVGWHTVRFTYEDVVERPGHLVAMIRAYLSRTASA